MTEKLTSTKRKQIDQHPRKDRELIEAVTRRYKYKKKEMDEIVLSCSIQAMLREKIHGKKKSSDRYTEALPTEIAET